MFLASLTISDLLVGVNNPYVTVYMFGQPCSFVLLETIITPVLRSTRNNRYTCTPRPDIRQRRQPGRCRNRSLPGHCLPVLLRRQDNRPSGPLDDWRRVGPVRIDGSQLLVLVHYL